MTLVLDWVPPGYATAEDYDLILKADEVQPLIDRIPLLTIDTALREGRMHLFRMNPGPGVVLTEVREAFGIRRLCLIRGAGYAGFQIRAILNLLDRARHEWGCECIETVVYSDRIKRAFERLGAKPEATIMTYCCKEPGDGQ